MDIIKFVRRSISSLREFSWETISSIFFSIVAVFVATFITPIILRWLLLPKIVTHTQSLDFTFTTCNHQLHGVCSFPEAIIDLDLLETSLSPGYYYTFSLDLRIFDSEQNRKLGVFQAQVTARNEADAKIATYKKSVLFRQTFYSSFYTLARNIMFFPLYILGWFSDFDTHKTILFTDRFQEPYEKSTKYLVVQLQSQYVQVEAADFHIQAHIGISSRLFNDYPVITYIITWLISFGIYCGIFALYWGSQIQKAYVNKED